jgi:hypothetical protein
LLNSFGPGYILGSSKIEKKTLKIKISNQTPKYKDLFSFCISVNIISILLQNLSNVGVQERDVGDHRLQVEGYSRGVRGN